MSETIQTDLKSHMQRLFAMTDLVTPMAIRVAATMQLLDHIDNGATTVDGLATATGADRQRLALLVGLLTRKALLETTGDGTLGVTPLGSLLLSSPGSLREMLDLHGVSGKYDTAVMGMLPAIADGANAFEYVHGVGYWEDLVTNTEAVRQLNAMEPPVPAFNAQLLSTGIDWSQSQTVLDVGGSNGSVLSTLLNDHPHLRGAVLDLPERIEQAKSVFMTRQVADRAEALGGSFFEEIPAGFDTYVFSAILADWDDHRAQQILTNVRRAAPDHARIVVSEIRMLPADAEPDYQLALRMLCGTGGVERTNDQIEELARQAGLVPTGASISTGQRSVQVFATA